MNKGKRYEEPKLNMKKVFAVAIAFIVMIMCICILAGLLKKDNSKKEIVYNEYFSAYKDEKWGVINEKGENVIEPSYREMIIIPNKKREVFLCTYDIDVNKNTYKTKAINGKNESIFTQYDKIEAISNIDKNGYAFYEKNIIKVQKDGKVGLIDISGKEILSCEYENIIPMRGIEKILKIEKDGRIGIIDEKGSVIVTPEYKEIESISYDIKDGFIIKDENEKTGMVNYLGKVILEPKYDNIKRIHNEKYFVIEEKGKEKIVDIDGKTILSQEQYKIKDILKYGKDGVIIEKENKYGILGIDGKEIIKPEYEELIEIKEDIFIAKKSGKFGVIDIKNQKKIEPKYNSINYYEKVDLLVAQNEKFEDIVFDNEYKDRLKGIVIDIDEEKKYIEIKEEKENKYYNLKFEERKEKDFEREKTLFVIQKDGKYGFYDKEGNIIIEPEYDEVTKQNAYGFAGIKKGKKWGVIDKEGNIIQEPTYDLEDYLEKDFIGRWHLGKDINMNYYNQL